MLLQLLGQMTIGLPIEYLKWILFGCVSAGLLLGAIGPRSISLTLTLRLLLGIPLCGFALFSVLGFLASFEGGSFTVYHVVYGAGGLACLSEALWLAAGPPASRRLKTIFLVLSLASICFVVFISGASLGAW